MHTYKEYTFFLNSSEEELFDYMMEIGVIWPATCQSCGSITRLSLDKKYFTCRKTIQDKKCKTVISVYHNSVFSNLHISLKTFFYILNEFRKDVICEIVALDTKVDLSTISRVYKKLRRIIIFKIKDEMPLMIGGPNKIVEFDETLLVKRKYNRGRILSNQKWIVVGAERGSLTNFFIAYVPHRSRKYLLPLMKSKIANDSTVVTDDWGAYKRLSEKCPEKNWTHLVINHSRNYVDPVTEAQTQTVEGVNSVIKRAIRRAGTNNGKLPNLLDKIIEKRYKKFHRNYLFNFLIQALVEYSAFE